MYRVSAKRRAWHQSAISKSCIETCDPRERWGYGVGLTWRPITMTMEPDLGADRLVYLYQDELTTGVVSVSTRHMSGPLKTYNESTQAEILAPLSSIWDPLVYFRKYYNKRHKTFVIFFTVFIFHWLVLFFFSAEVFWIILNNFITKSWFVFFGRHS